MPTCQWTTDAELDFLQSYQESFRSHQLSQSLQRFWPDIYNTWFTVFPEKSRILPDVEGKLSDEQQTLLQNSIKTCKRTQKIYNWYNNLNSQQNRKAKATRVNLDVLRPKGSRTLKDTELYSRKYYKDRVQPLVETELGERKVLKVERIEVIKWWTKQAYDAEDEDVKAEIQEEIRTLCASRAEHGTSESEGAEEVTDEHVINAIASQALLDDLPAILRQIFLELHRKTGWYFLVLAAGEVPGSDGQYKTISFHQEGDNLEHNIGRLSNFVDQFVRPFLEYTRDEINDTKASRESTSLPARSPSAALTSVSPDTQASTRSGPDPVGPGQSLPSGPTNANALAHDGGAAHPTGTSLTAAAPPATAAVPPATATAPPLTAAAPPLTAAAPPLTAAAPPLTAAAPPSMTAAPPVTPAASPSTNAAPPLTASAPPAIITRSPSTAGPSSSVASHATSSPHPSVALSAHLTNASPTLPTPTITAQTIAPAIAMAASAPAALPVGLLPPPPMIADQLGSNEARPLQVFHTSSGKSSLPGSETLEASYKELDKIDYSAISEFLNNADLNPGPGTPQFAGAAASTALWLAGMQPGIDLPAFSAFQSNATSMPMLFLTNTLPPSDFLFPPVNGLSSTQTSGLSYPNFNFASAASASFTSAAPASFTTWAPVPSPLEPLPHTPAQAPSTSTIDMIPGNLVQPNQPQVAVSQAPLTLGSEPGPSSSVSDRPAVTSATIAGPSSDATTRGPVNTPIQGMQPEGCATVAEASSSMTRAMQSASPQFSLPVTNVQGTSEVSLLQTQDSPPQAQMVSLGPPASISPPPPAEPTQRDLPAPIALQGQITADDMPASAIGEPAPSVTVSHEPANNGGKQSRPKCIRQRPTRPDESPALQGKTSASSPDMAATAGRKRPADCALYMGTAH
ncbi:uncharacterized protein C8Q71DRAFT_724986 [Rhodofomes roseus]|uniref:Uncharacterized protein n=1 Tax=Rhodofomes roseus TaxID=34475 RepID=A0ABQ8KA47_9APHY|nr:uncharacterized protein C8Q71DRAFT_724986 [Rhodofomes roseus]KAH9834381.1 hypothetical protein C8Q71DRAFT_724986 [Rhodofomes roseus]